MRSEGYCSCPVCVCVCVSVHGSNLLVAQLCDKLVILTAHGLSIVVAPEYNGYSVPSSL